jgi:hypothetical protein
MSSRPWHAHEGARQSGVEGVVYEPEPIAEGQTRLVDLFSQEKDYELAR